MKGVAVNFTYDALVTAQPSFDPMAFDERDDVTHEVDDQGNQVTLLRDWSQPPVSMRCKCQMEGKVCVCGRGAKPVGYTYVLYWDKVNQKNRYVLCTEILR